AEARERARGVADEHLRGSLDDDVEGVPAAADLHDRSPGVEVDSLRQPTDPTEVATGEAGEQRHLLEERDSTTPERRALAPVLRRESTRERRRLHAGTDPAHPAPLRAATVYLRAGGANRSSARTTAVSGASFSGIGALRQRT